MSEITKADLIAFRIHKNWSKSEMSRQLGVARNAYANYESGLHNIPPVIALACMCLLRGLPPYRRDLLDIMSEGTAEDRAGKQRRVAVNKANRRKTGRPYRAKGMHPRDAIRPLAQPDL